MFIQFPRGSSMLSLILLLFHVINAWPVSAGWPRFISGLFGDGAVSSPHLPAGYALHERQETPLNSNWEYMGRIEPHAILSMRITLAHANREAGARYLQTISDPTSVDYGKHMKAEHVVDMFAPSEPAVAAVRRWLVDAGLRDDKIALAPDKLWLAFEVRADQAEKLLATEFHKYHHLTLGGKGIAAREYHIPAHLRRHVDFITPGIHPLVSLRGQAKAKRAQSRRPMSHSRSLVTANAPPLLNLSACDTQLSADCIRAQYKIPNNTLAAAGNQLGIFSAVDEHYSREDLDTFFATLYPQIPSGTIPEARLIDGAIGPVEDVPGYNQSFAGVEANLDIMSSWPLIWPQGEVMFQTDDQWYETEGQSEYKGFWNTFFDALDGSYCSYKAYNESGDCTEPACRDPVYPNPHPGGYQGGRQCGVYKPTNVISISFSGGEMDLPASYLRRQCDEILKLALQGVTVVVSAGDYGPATFPQSGMANGCAGPRGTVFYPTRPSVCPYALSVGATELGRVGGPNSTTYTETATDYSGGGFSNYFARPWWQDQAVEAYFNRTELGFSGYQQPGTNFSDVGEGVYHVGGRGYPDVAAAGQHYAIFRRGGWGRGSGTSVAAPIWAAVLTLINERRIAAGKSTVGLVHPVLYAHPEVFNDVTKGSAPACNLSGFPAASGWDPISGLGTPNFPKLLQVFLELP